VALAVASVGITLALFGPLLWEPGKYLVQPYGDGIKNTYTYLWYVLHDHGHWFTGMNYPFGEHPNFPDVQPGLAWLVRGLQRVGVLPAGGAAALGALYWSLALGVAATPLALFALLRRASVTPWFAGAAALLITVQSPQIDRLAGHFALSYPFVIPVLWLLVVRLTERPHVWRALVLALTGLAVSLLTSYYVMCAVLLAGGYALMGVMLARPVDRPRAWRTAAWLLGATVVIFAGTVVWLALTDPYAAERTADPYGFFVYVTSLAGIFLPSDAPFFEAWNAVFRHTPPDFEGRVYVGIIPAIVLVLTAIRAARYLLRWPLHRMRPLLILRPVLPTFLRTGVWIAVLTLLFAMAYPFKWPWFTGLLDLIPPIKQLRALGRFAWVFYYLYATYSAAYLWQLARYLRTRQAAPFATSLLLVVTLLWGIDALISSRRFGHLTNDTPRAAELIGTTGSFQQYLTKAQHYTTDFQAILPLPAFSLGSEKWSLGTQGGSEFDIFRASLQTDIPLAATMMSRTSIRQTQALLSLVAGPLIARDSLLKARLDGRPLLLLVAIGAPLPAAQQRLVKLAQPLYTTDRVALYSLPIAAALADERAAALTDTAARVPLTPADGGMASNTRSGLPHAVTISRFAGNDHPGRSSQGAAVQPTTDTEHRLTLYDGPLPGASDTLRYETSVWLDLRTPFALPWLHVKQFDAAGTQLADQELNVKGEFDTQGHWVRAAVAWQRQPTAVRLHVYLDGDKLVADDLLTRPVRTHVWDRTRKGIITRDGYGLNGNP
jgi:hypothetical protein